MKDANNTLARDQNEQISHLKAKETKLLEEMRQLAETKDQQIENLKTRDQEQNEARQSLEK